MHSVSSVYRRRNSASPGMIKRKLTFSDEDDEQDGALEGEKMETFSVDDDDDDDEDEDEDDNEDLDKFEDDGFIVDDVEKEEEGGNEQDREDRQNKKKKPKKKSLKNIILDDDDLQLIQENKALGILQFKNVSQPLKRLKKAGKDSEFAGHSSFYDDSLFDDIYGEEEALSYDEDEMATFIVDDNEIVANRAPLRYWNSNDDKLRQAVVVVSPPVKEAGYLVGDVNEILTQRKQALAMIVKPDNSNEFEPFFLVDKYMTERDDYVREVDLPERMQVFEEIVGPPPVDEMSINEESDWILSQLAKNVYPLFCTRRTWEGVDEGFDPLSKIKKADIMRFLELHHIEKYDIPFIAMYRKEQCISLLENVEQDEGEETANGSLEQACRLKWHKVLWTIKELDKKWLLLEKRKTALQMYYEKRYDEECEKIGDDIELSLHKWQPFDSIVESLTKAEWEGEINDVDVKFSLHFPLDAEIMDGKLKRPYRKSLYGNCKKAGLWKLAGQFGCNSEKLGVQIALEKVGMEFSEDHDEAPAEIASIYTCPMFENPEAVLKGARHMAAMEISCEPCIRKYVRSIFMDKAVVSTNPTAKGNVAVDSLHQFTAVKWLCDKPLSKFKDAQWLLIQRAEEEKLLQVTMRLPENVLNNMLDNFSLAYLWDGAGPSAELWNEQRKLILQDTIFNLLLPAMEKEARVTLIARAKNWLLMEYGKQLWKRVSVGPYLDKENIANLEKGIPARVMACCRGPGNPATTFVMLDSSGELLDVLDVDSLHLRSQNVYALQRKKSDKLRVLKFIVNHQPHVIVIGAANVSCVELKDTIKEIVSKTEESRDAYQAMGRINVVYGDEALPQLYESSQISSDQLPTQSGIVKRAVALGRYIQNPLAMVANLCGIQKEIVSWTFSPLEHYLMPDEKYEMIEQIMVDVTNQVGLDINMALKHVWYLPLLQFVSGLGPQKAAFLRREMVEGRAISGRKDLTSFGLSTKVVFHNAVGFLCVRHSGLLRPCTDIELLDDTRIHPESYGLAGKLAKAICNDALQEEVIKYVKENPELLNEFNVDDYADNYEIVEGENMKESLRHIKMELLYGFQDPRAAYKEPTQDEEFKMITSKYGDAFAEGRIIEAKVQQVQSQRAFCMLDLGLTGILMKDDFLNEGGDFALQDKLHGGDTISCKIKHIDKTSYQVILTCKDTDMKRTKDEDFCDVDPYYCEGESCPINQKENACKDKEFAKQNFMPRIINHPKFKNMSLDQAVEFLSDKDVGDSLFRPSSRGPSHLTLTLKVFEKLYVHKDIIEGGKDQKNLTSLLHLGTILKIGEDTYGNLDEVMDQYVDPVIKHLKEMLSFQKFKGGLKADVDKLLKAERSEDPMKIVYGFGVSYEHPGTFILTYIRSGNPHHEYVGLLPKGFKFRKCIFEKIEHLVVFFQKHIHIVQPNSETCRKPSLGISTGEYMGSGPSGWQGQLNSSKGKSVSRGADDYCGDGGNGNEHPSQVGPSKWGSCLKDEDGTLDGRSSSLYASNTWNSPNNESVPVGGGDCADAIGGNWCSDYSNRNSGWSKGSGDDNLWSGLGGVNTGGQGRGRGFGRNSSDSGYVNNRNETGWGRGNRDQVGAGGWRGNNDHNRSGGSWGSNRGGLHVSGGNRGGRGWGRGRGQRQDSSNKGDDDSKENWGSDRGNIRWSNGDDNGADGWGSNNDTSGGGFWGGNNYAKGGGSRGGKEGGWHGGVGQRGGRALGPGPSRGGGRGQRHGSYHRGGEGGEGNFHGEWNRSRNETGWGSSMGNGTGGWGGNKENESGGWHVSGGDSQGDGNGRGWGRGRDSGQNRSRGHGPRHESCNRGDDREEGKVSGGWNRSGNENRWGGSNDGRTGGNWGGNKGGWCGSGNNQDYCNAPHQRWGPDCGRGQDRGGRRGRGNKQGYLNDGDDDKKDEFTSEWKRGGNWGGGRGSSGNSGRSGGNWGSNGGDGNSRGGNWGGGDGGTDSGGGSWGGGNAWNKGGNGSC
ncbi:hypothetical protein SLA2020_463320 [Shorea laevis]